MRLTGLPGVPIELSHQDRDAFAATLAGEVLQPDAAGFAEATQVWNGMITTRPGLVVRPRATPDVAATVNFARDNDVELSMKGGGHNIAGLALTDGGLTLDMSGMRYVRVDAAERLARVGPGCTLGDVDPQTQTLGLATTLGFVSATGVAGLTLGGGFGYLSRGPCAHQGVWRAAGGPHQGEGLHRPADDARRHSAEWHALLLEVGVCPPTER